MSAPMEWSQDIPMFPHRCPLTGLGQGESTFFRTEFVYRSADVMDDRPHVLFLSEEAIREIVSAEGSPFISPHMENQELKARVAELEDEVERLRANLDEAEAPNIILDGDMLAQALAKPLAKAMKNGNGATGRRTTKVGS